VELVLSLILGGIVSWALTHAYYRKGSIEVPEWAKPIVANLPSEPPSKERLLELFQTALNKGDVTPDPVFGHVACPECHSPFGDIEKKVFGDDRYTVVVATCPHCGWSADADVS
jgi:hypothetical protein